MGRYTLGEEVSEGMHVLLKDGTPTNARASKHARFGVAADIYGGEFRGGVFYGGEFRGGVFRGGVFYDGWLSLQIQGSKHFVNIPDGKTIQIGCKNCTPAWWRANYKTVGAEQGYTEAQIAEYAEYIRLASKMIRANQKAEKAK